MTAQLSPSIFKAYDIRGILGKTLDTHIAYLIGRAFGSIALSKQQQTVIVGRDGRLSGPELIQSLAQGLQESGMNVIDLGMVATPMLYFATHTLKDPHGNAIESGIMVTGSHNPPDYNGFKMVMAGEAIYGDAIQHLYQTIIQENFTSGAGKYSQHPITDSYIERIVSDVKLTNPLKIAIDCGNGVAGAFAGRLFKKMGCDVIELFCEVDGNFPNHHPDPAHLENLEDLMHCLRNTDAQIGLAFDGDGDRLGVVTKEGHVIFPDRQLMLFAKDVLSRNPNADILYDVKCTRHLSHWILQHGGKPLMWKTGHSLVKAKLKETQSPLGGEMSGHIFFKDRWYGFDDGLYAGARLLEILSTLSNTADISQTLDNLPQSLSTPELQLQCEEGENFKIIQAMQEQAQFVGAKEVITIDGLRIEYEDGFGLARSSNTTPVIVMRFEAENEAALKRIQAEIKNAIIQVKPDAQFHF